MLPYSTLLVLLPSCEGMSAPLFFLKMLGNGERPVFVFLSPIDLAVSISLSPSRDSLEEDLLPSGTFRPGLSEPLRRDSLEAGLILEVDILSCEESSKEWRPLLSRYFFLLSFAVVWLNSVSPE